MHWLAAWLPRLAIVYLLVYMAPFPVSVLGYLARIPVLADSLTPKGQV